MLRLTGLPASSIYPLAIVRPAGGRIEIVFIGEERTTRVDVDVRLRARRATISSPSSSTCWPSCRRWARGEPGHGDPAA